MRKRSLLSFLVIVLLGFSSAFAGSLPSIGGGGSGGLSIEGSGKFTASEGDFTLMLYMIGSNLESDYGVASQDIKEIALSGADFSSVNVVVAAGGASHWQELSIRAGEVGFGTIKRNSGDTGVIWDQKISGSISTESMLSRFLKYAYDNYPAKKYAIVFWNHGGGPLVGFGHDEVANNIFSMKQLANALSNSPFSRKKLTWAGFDACLMGSYEVMAALAPYVDTLIFSEETEPGSGWDYSFVGDPAVAWGGIQAGRRICDCYADSLQGRNLPYTISTVLCGNAEIATRLLDSIFSVKMTDDLRIRMARAAYASQSFGLVSTNSTYDLYDLVDFVDKLCDYWPLSEKSKEGLKFSASLLVEYNRSNLPGAHGLSFYFPLFTDPSRVNAKSVYEQFSLSRNYLAFLRSTKGIANSTSINGGRMRTYDGRSRTTGEDAKEPAKETTYTFQMTDEQKARFVLAEYVILFKNDNGTYDLIRRGGGITADENGLLSVSMNDLLDCIPSEDEGASSVLTLIERDRTENERLYFLPAELLHDGSRHMGSLQYFERKGHKVIGKFVPYDGTDIPPKQLLSLSEGDELTFLVDSYRPVTDECDEVLPFTLWEKCNSKTNPGINVKNPADIYFESISADPDCYFLQIIGTDADGNWFCSPMMPFGVRENSEENEK